VIYQKYLHQYSREAKEFKITVDIIGKQNQRNNLYFFQSNWLLVYIPNFYRFRCNFFQMRIRLVYISCFVTSIMIDENIIKEERRASFAIVMFLL